jgi:hypothetical protein
MLGLGIAILVVGIALWFSKRQTTDPRQLAAQMQAVWQASAQTVRYGPIPATWFGFRGEDNFRGVLAILDDAFIFTIRAEGPPDLTIPLNRLRWIGFWQDVGGASEKRAVRIEVEDPDVWRVLTFVPDPMEEFAQQLSEAAELPVDYSGGGVETGPIRAERLRQNVYGKWEADRHGLLFLAPDRLLFDWREPVFLASIRRLGVIIIESANPLAMNILRVEYEDAESVPHTVGFKLRTADDWAEMLHLRTDAPVERSGSRKKKGE